jgi:hypothetical protein
MTWLLWCVATPAWAGGSRQFDGVDDYLNCGSPALFDNVTRLSVVAWIKPAGYGENGHGWVFSKTPAGGLTSGPAFATQGGEAKNLEFTQGWSKSTGKFAWWQTPVNSIALNVWQAVAVTYEGNSTANDPRFYVDGVLQTTAETRGPAGSRNSDAANTLYLGNRGNTDRTFNGKLAHVHFYNRALTATEIAQLKQSPGSITNGLIAYWPLSGSGSQELDLSGNGNHCAVSGATASADGPPLSTDTTPPSGTVTINSGATATHNPVVTLTLSATDNSGTVAQMQCSNDGTTYSAAEAYATTKTWTLASGDGTKTVYVKFKDAAGNWSAPASDSIVLDTTPPAITITSPVDGAVITAP